VAPVANTQSKEVNLTKRIQTIKGMRNAIRLQKGHDGFELVVDGSPAL
jgi:hypothetical protein